MKIRSLGYRTDIALLELSGSTVEDRGDHALVRSPQNPVHWWGNFLLVDGVPAPEEAAEWKHIFHQAFPDARYVAIGIEADQAHASDLASFASLGLEIDEAIVLVATEIFDPPEPTKGLELRPLTSDGDWAQSIELRVRCEDRNLDPEMHREFVSLNASSNRRLTEAGHGVWFGAFVDGQLASQMGLVRVNDGLGRFQSVETDPDLRRQGLAKALLETTGQFGFTTLGAAQLVIVADPSYFAIDLYRSVGFKDAETQIQVEMPER
jgi:ribosomal protein S18 acetylase RimI-like enzyme